MAPHRREEASLSQPRAAPPLDREAIVAYARRTWVPFALIHDKGGRDSPAANDPRKSTSRSKSRSDSSKGSSKEEAARNHGRGRSRTPASPRQGSRTRPRRKETAGSSAPSPRGTSPAKKGPRTRDRPENNSRVNSEDEERQSRGKPWSS
eukprot:15097432-Heterocapsa_arctica.AAC.1